MFRSIPLKLVFLALSAMMLAGCAGSKVSDEVGFTDARLPKPSQINVYDFAVHPDEIKQNSGILASLIRKSEPSSVAAEEMEIGHEVADALSDELVKGLKKMGFYAIRANQELPVDANTLLIAGAFVDIDEGNSAERTVVGLGLGESKLDSKVSILTEGAGGSRELAGFDIHTDSGSMPVAAVMGPAGLAAGAGTASVAATDVAVGAYKGYRSESVQEAKKQADKILFELGKYFLAQGWILPDQVP